MPKSGQPQSSAASPRTDGSNGNRPGTEVTRSQSQSLAVIPSISLTDPETVEFAGDSSLHAHSVAARNLLVRRLGDQADLATNSKLNAALDALRRIVEANVTEPSARPQMSATSSIYDLKLPPTDFVLELLRKSKGTFRQG